MSAGSDINQDITQQNISIQRECLEKNTKLNLGGTVSRPPVTGTPQLRVISGLPKNQSYTRESNAADIGSAQNLDVLHLCPCLCPY